MEKAYAQHCADPLSYVGVAIVSSLRSSAIPLTAAYVSNVCRSMSGDLATVGVKGMREVKGKVRGSGEREAGRNARMWQSGDSPSKEELPGTSFLWP